jgi:hypothetical protein
LLPDVKIYFSDMNLLLMESSISCPMSDIFRGFTKKKRLKATAKGSPLCPVAKSLAKQALTGVIVRVPFENVRTIHCHHLLNTKPVSLSSRFTLLNAALFIVGMYQGNYKEPKK